MFVMGLRFVHVRMENIHFMYRFQKAGNVQMFTLKYCFYFLCLWHFIQKPFLQRRINGSCRTHFLPKHPVRLLPMYSFSWYPIANHCRRCCLVGRHCLPLWASRCKGKAAISIQHKHTNILHEWMAIRPLNFWPITFLEHSNVFI